MRHYPMVNVRDVVDEPSANEPGHRRLSTEDYWRLLSEQMGQIATEQAQIRRAIEQAQERWWEMVLPSTGVPDPINPPPGDWKTLLVYMANGNVSVLVDAVKGVGSINGTLCIPVHSPKIITFSAAPGGGFLQLTNRILPLFVY